MGRSGQGGRGGREAIEKARLATRVEAYERYEDPGRLTEFVEGAQGYAPESERFDKDFAVVESQNRGQQRQRHGAIIDARRQERMDREEERWMIAETQKQMEAERQLALQDTDKAKANRSSLPYDPITLMYDDGNDGERLKYYDDKTRVRRSPGSYASALCADRCPVRHLARTKCVPGSGLVACDFACFR